MQSILQAAATALELPDTVVFGVADAAWAVFGPLCAPFDSALTAALPQQVGAMRAYFESERFPTQKPLPLSDPVVAIFAMLCYPLGLFALYLFSSAVGKLKCKTIGLIHNFFLFSLSLYMWAAILVTAASMFGRLWNHPMGNTTENDWRLAKLMWVFYISKLPEFGDTFLMVLKQNYHQITFLHVYHHTSIFLFWYYICVVAPGGDAYFSAMLNSGIHVIMYGYYFFTMLFQTGPIRRFFDSIKFMITKGQMTQFMLNVVQSIYLVFFVSKIEYHENLAKALFVYMLTLLALFGNFLIKGQSKARAARKAEKALPAGAEASPAKPVASARPSGRASAVAAPVAPVFEEAASPAAAGKRSSTPKRRSTRKE